MNYISNTSEENKIYFESEAYKTWLILAGLKPSE